MRRLTLMLFLLLTACSSGVFKVPTSEYQQQVKTLGVLPVLVDAGSPINHPQADEVLALLRRAAEGRSTGIVDAMRRKKGYFDVRLINEPARLVAEKLLFQPQRDELGQPLSYQLNQAYLAELCGDAVVDGLLVLTLQGAVHNDKRWSRNTFENLTTDFNDIMATASVVAADGRVLWEMAGDEAAQILALQYADFDEAYYNKTEAVQVKYISLAGLQKTLLPTAEEGQAQSAPQLDEWLQRVSAALSPSLFR